MEYTCTETQCENQDFSAIQILREINVDKFRVSNTAILTFFKALNFELHKFTYF